jgi:hypothetical protein
MVDQIVQAKGAKALAWLKVHWYSFGIGVIAGVLFGHVLW